MTASTGTILLVEDDPNDVILIQRAFRRCEIANPISVVSDGDAAVAYLAGEGKYSDRSKHPVPSLIILDLKLPRRGGLEVLEWVKAQAQLKRIPTVVLTSSRQSSDVSRAYDLGANSYLVKPVTFESLTELVRNLEGYWLSLNEKPGFERS